NRKSKDIDNNEREGIIRNDSPMPTRSSFVQNPVDHLEYLAAQEEYAPPQTPRQHDSEPSDHQYQYVGLSSLGQYPIYLSNLEMTEQYNNVSNEYITESNIPQEIETSLPLSPLDEVQTNLKTVTLHQITYAHSPQFQNAIIEVTEDATQQQEHLNPTLPS
ncbi:7798_t:CDS:1, partial [Scutellospora calospora]